MNATIDFETRSACSLKKAGPWKYSIHPSTEILCLVFRLPEWEPERTALWHPAFPQLGLEEHLELDAVEELFDWIGAGRPVEAHNVWFEFCIWRNILMPRYDWPDIPLTQWRCSAAKASSHALPRGLDDAITALDLPLTKDAEGHKLMLKMSKPRRSRKKERETWAKQSVKPPKYLWYESADLFARLIAYCRQDVLAEEGLSAAIPDLSPHELDVFHLDLTMNLRGFQLDKQAVRTALRLLKQEGKILNRELSDLTHRQVRRATQRARMMAWCREQGVELLDTQKETLDGILASARTLPADVHRGLEIVRTLGRSSTAKYNSMKTWMTSTGRVYGALLYHGASTGRWTGKGVQPQNFVKGTIKDFDVEQAWMLLKTEDRTAIQAAYPSVMEALACALRGAIVAKPKHQLYCADYASIEARVLLWLAREELGLKLFREGGSLYLDIAQDIYHRPITKDDKTEYGVGKISILGLGYGMGASKFAATCESFGVQIDEDFAQEVIDTYRAKYDGVKTLWYATEDAAIQAVRFLGRTVRQDRVTWQVVGNFLYCVLPSGRRLAYPFPELRMRATPWGAEKPSLTFMGVDAYSHKWKRQHTYGGSLVENCVQAIARDLMADAMLRVEQSGVYTPVLSVHDEVIVEAKAGTGDVHSYEQLVAECPDWASGLPVVAEGWRGNRYHK